MCVIKTYSLSLSLYYVAVLNGGSLKHELRIVGRGCLSERGNGLGLRKYTQLVPVVKVIIYPKNSLPFQHSLMYHHELIRASKGFGSWGVLERWAVTNRSWLENEQGSLQSSFEHLYKLLESLDKRDTLEENEKKKNKEHATIQSLSPENVIRRWKGRERQRKRKRVSQFEQQSEM